MVAQQIQAVITRISEDPEFDVVEIDPYGLTVPDYDTFRTDSWQGLTETYDDNYVNVLSPVDGVSYRNGLIDSITKLKRGSFGISGERGAGKTSLMYALRDQIRRRSQDTREFLDVWLGAPTSIDETAFLLSVLAKLASRVGSRITDNSYFPHMPPADELREGRIRRRNMAVVLVISVLTALACFGALLLIDFELVSSLEWGRKLVLIMPIVTIGPILLWGWRWLQMKGLLGQSFTNIREEDFKFLHGARNMLEQLWFDQRETFSSSAGISGMGVDFSGGWSKEKTRRPFTLPQLVQMWDDFVNFITTGQGRFSKVVVFIDEVDKIKDTEEIDRFMRILKTLYRPPNLFFIVSISEDAYELYQTRAVARGQRNVFDSSFDHFIQVKVMSSADVPNMLRSRIFGESFPRPFVQLIWLISRGNPRDCVRLARDLVRLYQEQDISVAAPYLINEHQFEPLLEQYKPYLSSKLPPNDHQQILLAVAGFAQAINDRAPAVIETLEPLRMIIQRETASQRNRRNGNDAGL